MKNNRRVYNDEDHLQADVMRFMAIVAFCLIAILAMVKQTPTHAHQTTAAPQSANAVPGPPAAMRSPPQPAPGMPKPVAALELAKVQTTKINSAKATATETDTETETETETETATHTTTQTDTESAAAGNQGITLRFASARDFLRLVNSGQVTLYAYYGRQFLAWDRRQRFSDATPPHLVYELDAATIPELMLQALPNSLVPANASWAVALPAHMQKQIQHHLNRVDSGELHINRYQEVHHVPAG